MKTIKDIAQLAEVSIATVSRALNSPESVSPETLERIQKIIKKTGFTPNKLARSLKIHKSKSIGIVVSEITNPFQVKIIKGIESVLTKTGYSLLIMDTEEDPQKESFYVTDLLERQIDGLICIPTKVASRLPDTLKNNIIPVVLLDRPIISGLDCIMGNNFSGISMLINHLLSKGCQKIALIGGPEESYVGYARNEAWRTLTSRFNLPNGPEMIRLGDFTMASGYRAAQELLMTEGKIDALVVINNMMGMGALRALRERRATLKYKIEFVVFDEIGDLVDPPVTYVQQPAFEMGVQATNFLLERINGKGGAPRKAVHDPVLYIPEI